MSGALKALGVHPRGWTKMASLRSILFALLLLLSPLMRAAGAEGPTIRDHLAAAKTLQEQNDLRGALDRVGDAILLAHERGDLVGEGEAVLVLENLAKALPEAAAAKGKQGPPSRREAMGLLMARLAPRRSGAFVSANALARNLALLGAESGDKFDELKYMRVLLEWSKGKTGGEVAEFYLEWTVSISTMEAVGPIGKRGGMDGFPEVRKQIAKGVTNGWAEEVAHAATDMAAFQVRFGKDVGALEAMRHAERACREAGDASVLERWQKAVNGRLRSPPTDLLEPLRGLAGKFEAIPVGTAAQGRPARATGLGSAFGNLKGSSVLVKVTRTEKGFDVAPSWNSKGRLKLDYGAGVRFLEVDGLILAFRGRSVGLYAVDLDGCLEKPGDGLHDLTLRSLYPLGRNEAWTLRKDGTVLVTR